MPLEIVVPPVGESISEVEIGEWLKKPGEPVRKDENIVLIESEKATIELPAPEDGSLSKCLKKPGETAAVGEVIALFEAGKASGSAPSGESAPSDKNEEENPPSPASTAEGAVMPAARKLMEEKGVEASQIKGSGPSGRILKEDVQRHLQEEPAPQTPSPAESVALQPSTDGGMRQEEVIRMSPLRRTIARRLVEAQQSMAMLTTFNEVDMTAVQKLRAEYKDVFLKKHGVKLGFMSFFIKSVIEGLKDCPQLNAEIRDQDIVYRNYFDIGVAIGGGKGLVVPVIRNAESLSFAEVEKTIGDLAQRAQANKIKPDELTGGTFTISNGGVYGSLLSTPIVNPPQSGVLGMHAIQDRPMAVDGQVVVRPMMYLALSYDHRIVDGREAVTFLRRVKDLIENPARMLLEV